jgi:hypothetical protein
VRLPTEWVTVCAVEMATCVLDEQSKNKLETVQLSNNNVNLRIQDVSADI